MRDKIEGLVLLEGGVQVSVGEGFGKMRWTVVKAIFRRGGVGLQLVSVMEVRVNWSVYREGKAGK